MADAAFKDARREQTSLLAPYEKRLLVWFARRMPGRVNSDHLTFLGFVAMLFAGLSYALARWNRWALLAVIFWLAVNWFGDSLDGTLARVRNRLRPRYGFYVDHITDAFGTFFLLAGLGASGYMHERVAAGLLVAYFLLSIQSYLATYALGTFQLSFWKFSPTELRILLAAGNVALFFRPVVRLAGGEYRLFDIGGVVGVAGMSLMAIVSAIRNARALYLEEKLP